jgi:lysophospholipase L1-like esterase
MAVGEIYMKTLLCYGDSNTWGYDPVTQARLPRDARWTGVLRQAIGSDYLVLEEGLNGRTTVWDDPIEGDKNGAKYLVPCLSTHRPLELVIILLGTNDLKLRFSLSAFDIANGAGVLVDLVQRCDPDPKYGPPPKVLLLAPPPVSRLTEFAEMFAGAEEKSRRFAMHYQRVAEERGCAFLDTATVIVSSDLDGIHFEAVEHRKLGQAVAAKVRGVIG